MITFSFSFEILSINKEHSLSFQEGLLTHRTRRSHGSLSHSTALLLGVRSEARACYRMLQPNRMKGSRGGANQQVGECVLQSAVLEECKVWSGDGHQSVGISESIAVAAFVLRQRHDMPCHWVRSNTVVSIGICTVSTKLN